MGQQIQAQTVEQRVARVISDHLGMSVAQVTPTATFKELDADSLDLVELVIGIEDEFNLEIPDEETEKWANVGDLVNYVHNRLR